MLSVHTSPLEQPGTGDAGGMNVYVVELSKGLARRGIEVEIFTRATSAERSDADERVELGPGVHVRHVLAGPLSGLSKNDLPGQLCAFTAGVMRAEAFGAFGHHDRRGNGLVSAQPWYDIVHSHYWLSGQVGWLVADRWNVPLVHSMHTMAKVKNGLLAAGDTPEPVGRVIGEEQVVAAADRLIANTDTEASELINLYGADPGVVQVVHPGVDLDLFSPLPGGPRSQAELRARLGLPVEAHLLLFAGRIQPLKGPDVLIRAAAEMLRRDPALRPRLAVVLVGGPSGSGMDKPTALADLAAELGLLGVPGVPDVVQFRPPMSRAELADHYRAADLVVVPSRSESFGLVAIEAQACGVPVVAARVGGLPVAVADEVSGVLVDGHGSAEWSAALAGLLADPDRRQELGRAAVQHATAFGWDACVEQMLQVYSGARSERLARLEAAR